MKRSFIREILEHTTDKTISFAGGLPDESLFPLSQLQNSAYYVFNNASVLQYTTSQGYEPLRKKIANFYCNQGFFTTSDEILITSGSQQALDIISRCYKQRMITIESPSYLGAMNVFDLNGMQQSTVNLESEGIDLEGFEKSFKKTALAYLIPDFQNPTGVVYSQQEREKIAKIIKERDGVLIEDSPYSELFFIKRSLSISSKIPDQSFHLGSFSKILAPALRIGWIRANRKLLQSLIPYKETMDLHTNSIAQRIIDNYLDDHDRYIRYLETLRSKYAQKMEFFVKTLDEFLPMFTYKKPKGGLFIYGSLPRISTSELLKKCLKQNVVFVPGKEFYSNNANDNEIRFNFSRSSEKEIIKGIKIIHDAYRELI